MGSDLPKDLTLDQALALAEQNHPNLKHAIARIEEAEGRTEQAAAFPNPELLTRMESAPFRGATGGEAEYLAGFSQAIPLGSRLSKSRIVGEKKQLSMEKSRAVTLQEVQTGVRVAFVKTLFQNRNIQVHTRIFDSATRGYQIIQKRFDAGDASQEELSRSKLEMLRNQQHLQGSKTDLNKAFLDLAAAIGDSRQNISSVSGTLETTLQVPELKTIFNNLSHHPILEQSTADIETAESQVDLAIAERKPDVNIEFLYRRIENVSVDAFDIGVRIPIPFFNQNQGQIKAAEANLKASKAATENLLNQLVRNAGILHLELEAALENTRRLSEDTLPQANTMLALAEARYSLGDANLTEILPIRREWAEGQLTYLEALHQAISAWSRLLPYLTD